MSYHSLQGKCFTMAIKLIALFALTLSVCGFVEPSLDKYGELGEFDLEGFQKRCFLRFHLTGEAKRYRRELVGPELDSDSMALWESLAGKQFEEFGNGFGCSQECYAKLFPTLNKVDEFGGQQLYDSKCANWAKFSSLCEQISAREGAGVKVPPEIKNVFCGARKSIVFGPGDRFHPCRDKVKRIGAEAADKSVERILAYTQEQLDEAKREIWADIETIDRMISEHNRKVTDEAYASVNRKVEEFLPKYKQCQQSEEPVRRDAEAKIRAAQWSKKSIFNLGARKFF